MKKEQAIKAYMNGKDIRIIVNGAWFSVMQDDGKTDRDLKAYIMHRINDLTEAFVELDGHANMTYEIMPDSTPEW